MVKLDHLTIFVADEHRARDWYTTHFGFRVEFEVADPPAVALQDDAGFTLFVQRHAGPPGPRSCVLTLQVADVHEQCARLAAAGVTFDLPPQRLFWGYGAELSDPDGYRIYLWDERTMREYGSTA